MIASMIAALILSQAPSVPTVSVPPLTRSKDHIKVATVQLQFDSDYLRDHDPVDGLRGYIERAARDQVDLLVFPEYILGDFKVGGPRLEKLRRVVADNGINVTVGGWQTLGDHPIAHPPKPRTYANSIVVIARDGTLVGTYHKTHAATGARSPYCWPPEPNELGEWGMAWGEETPVFDLDFGRIGILTCYDGFFFESFQLPSLKGAEILLWPNGRAGLLEEHIVRTASFMTCTHVITANMSVGAGSMVCAYPGNVVAIAPHPGEAYLTAEMDLAGLRVQRKNNRMFHQRRPERFRELIQHFEPWTAYPDIPEFTYPEEEGAEGDPGNGR